MENKWYIVRVIRFRGKCNKWYNCYNAYKKLFKHRYGQDWAKRRVLQLVCTLSSRSALCTSKSLLSAGNCGRSRLSKRCEWYSNRNLANLSGTTERMGSGSTERMGYHREQLLEDEKECTLNSVNGIITYIICISVLSVISVLNVISVIICFKCNNVYSYVIRVVFIIIWTQNWNVS